MAEKLRLPSQHLHITLVQICVFCLKVSSSHSCCVIIVAILSCWHACLVRSLSSCLLSCCLTIWLPSYLLVYLSCRLLVLLSSCLLVSLLSCKTRLHYYHCLLLYNILCIPYCVMAIMSLTVCAASDA